MSIIAATPSIRHFIKGRLGCGCPDEVFESIQLTHQPDCFNGLPVESLLEVGGRLLVAIGKQGDWLRLNKNLEQIIHAGILFRDRNGFNRFRLVIATDDEEVRLAIQQSYDSLTGKDEKTHIHFVTPKELPDELAERAE
jgi:hypothetical protein